MYAMQAWNNVTMNGKGMLNIICLNVNGSFCVPGFLSLSLAANVTQPVRHLFVLSSHPD